MRKEGKNIIHYRTIKIPLFPGFNGFPLLLGASPKPFTRPPFPPEFPPPSRLLPTSHPLFPDLSAVTSSPLFSSLSQTQPSSLRSLYTSSGTSVPPAGPVSPRSREPDTCLSKRERKGCPAWLWPMLPVFSAGFLRGPGPSKASF